ncbi:AAA domain containing protein [uncultured Caudovirales phage]|uniref:AAA domain containing protein n=1 Tax=uncultured Caudovirales phage TaxID=2100421 RepID=A0A6J5RW51_9CAUD|nr:AAA domain containing protein [uncultured Caudovirales phage]CAB4210293.1 AAA domain containing protein [uncultured Caudovirales phage]CAB5227310.1 AAA domain containing protein [uncultured Caudovirales phage]
MPRSLTMLVHGLSKVGKTWLGDTAPAPRLVFDAEGGNNFTASRKVLWNPALSAPPEADGTWDTCIIQVTDFQTVSSGYQWLASGLHPFKSVIIDSISEVQQRCVDSIAGTEQMKMQNWGDLLRQMSDLVRKFRDLTMHPVNPMEAIVIIAMTKTSDGRSAPYVQGQLATTLPYYIDVTGYFYTQQGETGLERKLLVAPHPEYEAGDRTGRLGDRDADGRPTGVVSNPNIESMLEQIYGPRANDAAIAPAATSVRGNNKGDKPS